MKSLFAILVLSVLTTGVARADEAYQRKNTLGFWINARGFISRVDENYIRKSCVEAIDAKTSDAFVVCGETRSIKSWTSHVVYNAKADAIEEVSERDGIDAVLFSIFGENRFMRVLDDDRDALWVTGPKTNVVLRRWWPPVGARLLDSDRIVVE